MAYDPLGIFPEENKAVSVSAPDVGFDPLGIFEENQASVREPGGGIDPLSKALLGPDPGSKAREMLDKADSGGGVIGAISDLGKGLYTGVTRRVPELLGQAMEFSGIAPETGKALADWGKEGEVQKEKGLFEQTGEMIPSSSGIPLALGTAGKLIKMIPHPAARIVGTGLQLASYLQPLIFGLSQAQQTKGSGEEKIKDLQDKIGLSKSETEKATLQTELGNVQKAKGWAPYVTGVIEWAGETAANYALQQLLGPLAGTLTKAGTATLKDIARPTIKQFLKTLGLVTLPTETFTEFGQQWGEALVEKKTGIRPEANPLQEGIDVLAPTALMTILTGGPAHIAQRYGTKKILDKFAKPVEGYDSQDQNLSPEIQNKVQDRKAMADIMAKMITGDGSPETKALSDQWRDYAYGQIALNLPVEVNKPIQDLTFQEKTPGTIQPTETTSQARPEDYVTPVDTQGVKIPAMQPKVEKGPEDEISGVPDILFEWTKRKPSRILDQSKYSIEKIAEQFNISTDLARVALDKTKAQLVANIETKIGNLEKHPEVINRGQRGPEETASRPVKNYINLLNQYSQLTGRPYDRTMQGGIHGPVGEDFGELSRVGKEPGGAVQGPEGGGKTISPGGNVSGNAGQGETKRRTGETGTGGDATQQTQVTPATQVTLKPSLIPSPVNMIRREDGKHYAAKPEEKAQAEAHVEEAERLGLVFNGLQPGGAAQFTDKESGKAFTAMPGGVEEGLKKVQGLRSEVQGKGQELGVQGIKVQGLLPEGITQPINIGELNKRVTQVTTEPVKTPTPQEIDQAATSPISEGKPEAPAKITPLRQRYNDLFKEEAKGDDVTDINSPTYRNVSNRAFERLQYETGRPDLTYFDLDKAQDAGTGKQDLQGETQQTQVTQETPVTPTERRADLTTRKKIDGMTYSELQEALLTNHLTGLPNKRAYEESKKRQVQVSIDVDSLKWINDNFGHQVGDDLLKAVGRALLDHRVSGFYSYHVSGDEFIVQGDDEAWIDAGLGKVSKALKSVTLKHTAPDGTVREMKGIGISYEKGQNLEIAERRLQENKKERETLGKRARRGERPPGVAEVTAQGGKAGGEEGQIAGGVRPAGGQEAGGENQKTQATQQTQGTQVTPPEATPQEAPGSTISPKKPEKAKLSMALGKEVMVSTARTQKIPVQYAIMEIRDLITSHDNGLNINPDYPQELQPRNRTRLASEEQIGRIINKLDPALLGENPLAQYGAPIVTDAGAVLSGNARTIALRRIYGQSVLAAVQGNAYQNWLEKNASSFGLHLTAIDKFQDPILVRVNRSGMDLVKLAQESNEEAIAAMSPSEVALNDAEKMGSALMDNFAPSDEGNLLAGTNREFIRLFMRDVVSPNEANALTTREGELSQAGINRIRNAVFAKAYGDTETLERMAESTDNNVRNITSGMLTASAGLMKVKAGIEEGRLYPLDISKDIVLAMQKLSDIRNEGITYEYYLKNPTMFDTMTPESKIILGIFNQYSRSAKKIGEWLGIYADMVQASPKTDQSQGNLFGDLGQNIELTKAELIESAKRKMEALYGPEKQTSQFDLFRGEPAGGRQEDTGKLPEVQKPGETGKVEGQEGAKGRGKLSYKTALTLLSLPAEQKAYPMGDHNKALRRQIIEEITGNKVPWSKAGATAVRNALALDAGINPFGKSGIEIEKGIIAYLKEKTGQGTGLKEGLAKLAEPTPTVNTEDSGVELTYNKRNRIKSGITWEDIADKNTALKVKETTKQNVYPRPDYQKMIDDGTEPLIAHLIKQVYDSIPAKPVTNHAPNDADLKLYIQAVNRVMEGTLSWTDNKDFIAAWATSQARIAGAALGKPTTITDLAGKYKTILDTVYSEGWKSYKDEVQILGGNKVLRAMQPGYDEGKRAVGAVKEGWPAKQESWQKQGYSVSESKKAITVKEGYTYKKDSNEKTPVFSLAANDRSFEHFESKEEAEKARGEFKEWVLLDKYNRIQGQFDSEAEAVEVAKEKVKRESKTQISDKGISVEMAERVGPSWRSNIFQGRIDSADTDAKSATDGFISGTSTAEIGSLLNVPLAPSPNWTSEFMDTSFDKNHPQVSYTNAKFLGNLSKIKALAIENFSIMDIPHQNLVFSSVLAATQDDKIRRSVIKFIPIDVMNNFTGGKLSADQLFGNTSVFSDFLAINNDPAIPHPDIGRTFHFVSAVADVIAKDVTLSTAFASENNLSAESTIDGEQSQGTSSGAVYRLEHEDISSDRLRETFSFSGINFGNWLKGNTNNAERQLHLNHAYDSFMDLADILGVPHRALSLNGMLGLAIGAQGSGAYAAHFVPGVNEINLTRTSGAGSLAHEFAHALDHYFATQGGMAADREPFLSEHTGNIDTEGYTKQAGKKVKGFGEGIRPEIAGLFKTIVLAMNKRQASKAEVETQTQAARDKAKGRIEGWLKAIRKDFGGQEEAFNKLADRVLALDLGEGKISIGGTSYLSPVVSEMRDLYKKEHGRVYSIENIKGLQANIDHYAYLNSEKATEREHVPQEVGTEYARNALRLDKGKGGKPYWSTNLEKFARAFDAYISDTLEEQAAKNTYLSHAGRTGETVPIGQERIAINEAFNKLFQGIETHETETGGVAMKETGAIYRSEAEEDAAIEKVYPGLLQEITLHFENDLGIKGYELQAAKDAFKSIGNQLSFEFTPVRAVPGGTEAGTRSEQVPGSSGKVLPGGVLPTTESMAYKVIGHAFAEDLIQHGAANYTGQVIEKPSDLALLAQVFRNPKFETFRIFFTRENKIVGHEGITSRLPGEVALSPTRDPVKSKEYMEKQVFPRMKTKMDRLGADGFWLVHNHPTGQVNASQEDLWTHQGFDDGLKDKAGHLRFKGGIIINGTKYGLLQRKIKGGFFHINFSEHNLPGAGADELLRASINHPLIGINISSPNTLATISSALKSDKGMVTAVYLSSQNDVRAIQEVPIGLFNNYKGMTDYFRGRLREFGATNVVPIFAAEQEIPDAVQKNVKAGIVNGHILDAAGIGEGRTARMNDPQLMMVVTSGFFSKEPVKTFKVGEVSELYHGSPHAFDRFRMEKVGTGEGAQAFGHGLYFTDQRSIAQHYANALSAKGLVFDGVEYGNYEDFRAGIDPKYFGSLSVNNRDQVVAKIWYYFRSGWLPGDIKKNLEKRVSRGHISDAEYKAGLDILDGLELPNLSSGTWEVNPSQGIRAVNKLDLNDRNLLYDMNSRIGYLADKLTPEEARGYLVDTLKKTIDAQKSNIEGYAKNASTIKDWDSAIKTAQDIIDDRQRQLDMLDDKDLGLKFRRPREGKRNLYNVTLHKGKNPGEYDYLSWYDMFTSEQRGKLLSSMKELGFSKGALDDWEKYIKSHAVQDVYKNLSNNNEVLKSLGLNRWVNPMGPKAASDFLLRSGIDGIKYPTETLSSGKPGKGFNYVVFDDNAISVEEHERYSVAPTFYSKMGRFLDAKLPNTGIPLQWKSMIENWAKKGEFKAEELKWSGLGQWLTEQKGRIGKEEVVNFLKANQVEIREVVKGENLNLDWNGPNEHGDYQADDKQGNSWEIQGSNEKFHLYRNGTPQGTMTTLQLAKEEAASMDEENPTKFSNWEIPGGENYRELLLTLPVEEIGDLATSVDFKSSHWSEPNVMAHVRFNEREGEAILKPGGPTRERVLFLEEIQSDWARELRTQDKTTDMDAYDEGTALGSGKGDVSPFPFAKNWQEVVLKRMLRYAAENGYDSLSWISGEETANRYDLSKHLSEVGTYLQSDGNYGLKAYNKEGGPVFIPGDSVSKDKLASIIGKDLAEKIVKFHENNPNTGTTQPRGSFTGLDLKVGGQWAVNLYDKIIPQFLSKYGKKWGARVEDLSITLPTWQVIKNEKGEYYAGSEGWVKNIDWATNFIDANDAKEFLDDRIKEGMKGNFIVESAPAINRISNSFQSIPITESMRESVLGQGQPLFAPGPQKAASLVSLEDVQKAFKGQEVTKTDEGYRIRTFGNQFIEVKEVDHIGDDQIAFETSYGRQRAGDEVIAGSYKKGRIKLVKGAANNWVLSHESVHMMEDAGIITPGEAGLLENHIRGLVKQGKFETVNKEKIGGQEDRANFIADQLTNPDSEAKGFIQKIVAHIQEFVDRLVNAFGGRTVQGITRDIETGKIFNREGFGEYGLTAADQESKIAAMSLKKGPGEITTKETSLPEGGELIIQSPIKKFVGDKGNEYIGVDASDSLSLLSEAEFKEITGVSKSEFETKGGSIYFIPASESVVNSIHQISGEILLSDTLKQNTKELRNTLIHELTHWGQIERGEAPKAYYADPVESIRDFMEYFSDPAEVKARFNAEGRSAKEYDDFMEELNWAKSDDARKLKMPDIGEIRIENKKTQRMPLSYVQAEIEIAKKDLSLNRAQRTFKDIETRQLRENIKELESIFGNTKAGTEIAKVEDINNKLTALYNVRPKSDTDVSNINILYHDIKHEWTNRRFGISNRKLTESEVEKYEVPEMRIEVLGKIDPKTGQREHINPIIIESYLREKTGINGLAVRPNEIDIELNEQNLKNLSKLNKIIKKVKLLPNRSTPPGVGGEVVTEPWKMTKEESGLKESDHKIVVQQALLEGNNIPIEVLSDYKGEKWADDEIKNYPNRPLFAVRSRKDLDQAKVDAELKKHDESFFQDQLSVIKDMAKNWGKAQRPGRPDTSLLGRFFGSPEFTFEKVPALKKVITYNLERADLRVGKFNDLISDKDGRDLQVGMRNLQKERPAEYDRLGKILVKADQYKRVYNAELIKKMGFSDQAVAAWADARIVMDNGFDRQIASYQEMVRRNAEAGLPAPTIVVLDEKGHPKEVSVKTAIALMGEMRGWYWPRLRESGAYQIVARATPEMKAKGIHNLLEFKDFFVEKRVAKLRTQGYQVEYFKSKSVPEDLFSIYGKVMGTEQMINEALNRSLQAVGNKSNFQFSDMGIKTLWSTSADNKPDFILDTKKVPQEQLAKVMPVIRAMGGKWYSAEKGEPKFWHFVDKGKNIETSLRRSLSRYDNRLLAVEEEFARALTTNVANIEKGRGFRSSMIQRGPEVGLDVWEGYEQDPLRAMTSYASRLAAGEAKKETALKMIRAFNGTEKSLAQFKAENENAEYEDYMKYVESQKVSPTEQKNAYHDGLTYIQEALRNPEMADRVVGVAKGLANFKYLGFRVAAPIVNLTALVTSVPAAMQGYAGIPLASTFKWLGKGADMFRQYRHPETWATLPAEIQAAFHIIQHKGWADSQYNQEAMAVLKSKAGRGWNMAMDASMWMFGITEQLNRVATLMGTFAAIREREGGSTKLGKLTEKELAAVEKAMETAKHVSDRAHGVYGPATIPAMAQGKGPAAMVLKSLYMFKKFQHNYLQTLYELGWKQGNWKAASYMMAAPTLLAGAAAFPIPWAWEAIMGIFKHLFNADDPEEKFYSFMESTLGDYIGGIPRQGIAGAGGHLFDFRGSLNSKVDIPTNMIELLGAPGSVLSDVYQGGANILKGNVWKGTEKVMPRAVGTVMQGYREYTEGVTTKKGAPVFSGREQIKENFLDALLKSLSFNPARIQRMKDIERSEKLTEFEYRDRRSAINSKFLEFFLRKPEDRSKVDLVDLIDQLKSYNERIRDRGLAGVEPMITSESLKMYISKNMKPSKREIVRDQNRNK